MFKINSLFIKLLLIADIQLMVSEEYRLLSMNAFVVILLMSCVFWSAWIINNDKLKTSGRFLVDLLDARNYLTHVFDTFHEKFQNTRQEFPHIFMYLFVSQIKNFPKFNNRKWIGLCAYGFRWYLCLEHVYTKAIRSWFLNDHCIPLFFGWKHEEVHGPQS